MEWEGSGAWVNFLVKVVCVCVCSGDGDVESGIARGVQVGLKGLRVLRGKASVIGYLSVATMSTLTE